MPPKKKASAKATKKTAKGASNLEARVKKLERQVKDLQTMVGAPKGSPPIDDEIEQ